ncbi:PilZ domain-containing protein [Bowmanella sp. JS7-9]|uniref:PilZ domain-containing protein n=1 Tax=Pseudobowmanella zhangzhouensis TaxID=1537679 RepID=A0ABW1XKM8_9ALTE|nr:PilZ domain-containing protein [Bowmanella sp. JS7-9]TBX25890.1 hypothetical protein TK45_04270 [Bowmanella sp. JS7-9]
MQDFEQFQDIIEQLKPVVGQPDFNQTLSSVATSVPAAKRFLLKLELKRLAKPCRKVIDLRGLVDGRCSSYEYDGLVHYLDDVAIDVFERQTRSFGRYTIGVYEAVTNTENNFRVIQQRAQQASQASGDALTSDDNFPARKIRFAELLKRSEERMNFAVAIEIFNEYNDKSKGTTLDISVQGLRIKVKRKLPYRSGERLIIKFLGLPGDHSMDKREGIPYEVIQVENRETEQRLALKRTHSRKTPSFDGFLNNFIHGNKRRYKLNLDNTIEAIRAKGYEQYYIPHVSSVPVFLAEQDGRYIPRYVLTNDCNKESIYYWMDHNGQLQLHQLLRQARIQYLLDNNLTETYLFSFVHHKDEQSWYYSASWDELKTQPLLANLFRGYGARKASWRVYKLQLCAINADHSFAPSSIPDDALDNPRLRDKPPAPRLQGKLHEIGQMALLTNITDQWNTRPFLRFKLDRQKLSALQPFIHNPVSNNTLSLHRFKYANMRIFDRYQLRTEIVLDTPYLTLHGVTEDVSLQGIKVQLNQPFNGNLYEEVQVSFPRLQEANSKLPLKGLYYSVRNISPDRSVLNLHILHAHDTHSAESLFGRVIQKNRQLLKTYQDDDMLPGLGEALRNVYSAHIPNVPFFVSKTGLQFRPDAILDITPKHSLYPLLSFGASAGQLNLYFLYAGKSQDFLQATLSKLKTNTRPVMKEAFVGFNPNADKVSDAITCRFSEEFGSDQARRDFISTAMDKGCFYAIKVFLARTGKPDTDMIKTEMQYLGVYALHKAKALEDQLWNISGVGDLIDVSDEAMLRYGFNQQHLAANHQALARLSSSD